ncbi:cytochrome b-c1 complex subunit 10 [Lipomyces tetrasporus]|uniref:Cytochrome b-c1 complex subunit 10 n=1 Tax=Lipomyces tetrasporus TaxID=54092 RepID=A0AAD7VVV6_9ASCO|nr:cytochrome b-c1 complex subunit 10 [Lipomyces tetrasporus]KAJ8103451.1 cytochrome b-c1 complex subunit 10 [Lipomyces tetrasporus]
MRVQYRYNPAILGVTPQVITRWVPIFGLWGGAVGVAALFFLEPIPRVRNVILQKIPAVGSYWDRPVDPNDSPF